MNGIILHKKLTHPSLRRKVNLSNFNKILPYLPKEEDLIALDAGCGDGDFAELLANKLRLKEIYGVDINSSALLEAKRRGLTVKMANLEEEIPFVPRKFDLIISRQVIEHLVNPDVFLKECNRVLKDSGMLIITTPNLACWFNRLIFLFGAQPFFLEASTVDKTIGLKFTRRLTKTKEPLGHIRVFTLNALKELLQLHGFRVAKSVGSEVEYLPIFMRPFDKLFSAFPSLSTDLIVIAYKHSNE